MSAGRRVLATVSVLLVALPAACGSSDPVDRSPSVAPSASTGPPAAEVLARIPVGGEPIGIATGAGSIWVVSSEVDSGGDPSLSRIDPATAAVTTTIPVGKVPLEVLATDEAVWVSNSGESTVTRIDPATDEPVATIDTCKAPEGFAQADGAIWVVCEGSNTVARIDPGDEPRRRRDPCR